jgi:TolA-binding protein
MHRRLLLGLALIACVATLALADEDTAKAAATRKLLKQKVTVEYKDEAFREVVEDLRTQIGKTKISIMPDTKSGVQLNTKITLTMKDVPLEEVLNAICDKNGWGYFIKSKEKDAYDGQLVVKVGKERGYEEGKEPAAKDDKDVKGKDKDKGKGKDKKEAKKTDPGEKAEPKDKAEPKGSPDDDEERAERAAALKLKVAKELVEDKKNDRAIQVLEELLKKYPKSKVASEAKELLEKLKE